MNEARLEKAERNLNVLQTSWRLILILYLISLVLYGGLAALQDAPGYMDADYYYAGGMQIAKGEGQWEPFLWNYLDDPHGIPHPSFAYWMPLAAWIAAQGMILAGSLSFTAAQSGMVLLAAGIPPLTAILALKLTDRPRDALLAGSLALFPGFYFPYLTTTDTFGIYMLLGTFFLLIVGEKLGPGKWELAQPAGLGIIAGLMHMARADGLIWLAVGVLTGLFNSAKWRTSGEQRVTFRSLVAWVFACLAGYLLVMGPWMARNLAVFGTFLAPGGARALWITHYDELYSYPASLLSFQHWLQAGPGAILAALWQALIQNFQTLVAVQGQIFLVPLIILGVWNLRRDPRVKTGLIAWMLTLIAMTFVFPYQGARGGLFHSGSAVQPLFWAIAPVGLRSLVNWGVRIRGWNSAQALPVFQIGVVGLAIFLTAFLVAGRVIGTNIQDSQWNHSLQSYDELGSALQTAGAQSGDIVMVNNAPGFFIATGHPALSVPYGSIEVTLQVAQRYHACFLLLEPNHPAGIDSLYREPGIFSGMIYLKTVNQTHLFRFDSCSRIPE